MYIDLYNYGNKQLNSNHSKNIFMFFFKLLITTIITQEKYFFLKIKYIQIILKHLKIRTIYYCQQKHNKVQHFKR